MPIYHYANFTYQWGILENIIRNAMHYNLKIIRDKFVDRGKDILYAADICIIT